MKEWILTTDHKRIGVFYLIGSIAAFCVAGLMALLIRTELGAIGPTLTEDPNVYNVWLYFHGAAMILGFQIPALTGFLANWAVPIMLGAPDMAFPRVNALSVWLYWMGILLALATFVIPDSPDVMWTGYPPYSVITEGNTALYSLTVLIMGFSSIVGGINIMCTVIYCRAKGMQYNQFNIMVWTTMGANLLQLVFVPVLGSAVMLLLFDKYLGTNFFNPASGGDVLIYENLFWFYSHPAVYVILLPFLGIAYEIIATFARNRIFNYNMVVYGGVCGTTLLSTDVWAHHAYAAGLPDYVRMFMTITTLLISVPVGLLMIGMVATMWNGAIRFTTPMLFALSVIFLFLIGGLTGIPNAMASVDHAIHDGYFIMAHFHYVMAMAGTAAIFGSVYYYLPKMTGKMYNEAMGKAGFWLLFIGFNVTFYPLFEIGIEGMARRYYDYSQFPQFESAQHLATMGSYVIAVGFLITLVTWIHCWVAGEKCTDPNPWKSQSIEFTNTEVIPGPGNFPVQPVISPDWSPYNYGGTTKQDD
ncbi:MAG: cbb3-type cytochrome c oxidase subunit I [Nitrospinae bacterium]|nr:cbb3-type cytochrome c oxidase subunit I [Nitrospinota bacterium]